MKKVLATLGLAGIVALSSYGQGYVIFSSSTQNISTNNAVTGAVGRAAGAGNYYYALFYSSTIASSASLSGTPAGGYGGYAWNVAGWTVDSDPTASGASTATAGRFAATAPNSDGTTTVPGVTGGNQYYFCIVGWSASLGTTLAAMEASLGTTAGYLGESAGSGLITTGNGTSVTPGGVMGGLAPTIQAFTLGNVTVPEPGTLALAALGGASLLLFRRKK